VIAKKKHERRSRFFCAYFVGVVGFLTNIGATNFWCTAKATITIASVNTPLFRFSVENIFFKFLG
jgi:hypothetical protein